MSRTFRRKAHRSWYATECPGVRAMTRRRWRREGRRLLEDAPPQKGTQGWLTW